MLLYRVCVSLPRLQMLHALAWQRTYKCDKCMSRGRLIVRRMFLLDRVAGVNLVL